MFGFIERVVIPSLVLFVLLGGLAGVLLGAALIWRSAAALRFVARMNRWVSSREALQALEAPRSIAAAPSAAVRRVLGAFLLFGGAFAVAFLFARLGALSRGSYVPGVDLERWLVSGVTLATLKWVLIAGSAAAFAVGVLMLFFPARLAALEARMDHWYYARLPARGEDTTITPRMFTPLEPRVQANPRAAGWIIAVASLLVAAAMLVLLFARLG